MAAYGTLRRELADNDADRQAIDRWLQAASESAEEPTASG